jgi:hypothetical protein
MARSGKHDKQALCFIKCGEFPACLEEYEVLKKQCAQQSLLVMFFNCNLA